MKKLFQFLILFFVSATYAQTTVTLPQLCDCPPGAFNLTAPSCANPTSGAPLTLTWDAVTGASHYDLVIDVVASLNSPEASSNLMTTNTVSIPVTGLMPSTMYYWNVIAYTASGSAISANGGCSFTTNNSFTATTPTDCLLTGCPVPCTTPSAMTSSPGNVTIPFGSSQTFTCSGGSPGTITWTAAGGTPSSGTGTSATVSWATSGAKTIIFTSTNNNTPAGCSLTSSQTTTSNITVSPASVPCGPAGAGWHADNTSVQTNTVPPGWVQVHGSVDRSSASNWHTGSPINPNLPTPPNGNPGFRYIAAGVGGNGIYESCGLNGLCLPSGVSEINVYVMAITNSGTMSGWMPVFVMLSGGAIRYGSNVNTSVALSTYNWTKVTIPVTGGSGQNLKFSSQWTSGGYNSYTICFWVDWNGDFLD